ncbi:MAG: CoA-binding protein [Gammaproteobacteria bacterium]|nr:CoA-binding protein [Gammaproteobacteria bacterium]
MSERVAILGASADPTRFSNQAFHLLRSHGHTVLPVNPQLDAVADVTVAATMDELTGPIDTVTVYLRPALAEPLCDDIIAARPKRVIFNPGTESQILRERLQAQGIGVQWECTLVLLREGRY